MNFNNIQMNSAASSLLAMSALCPWPIHQPYWPRQAAKTPDIPFSQEVKSRLEQETIAKSKAKALRREQNKERDRKKT